MTSVDPYADDETIASAKIITPMRIVVTLAALVIAVVGWGIFQLEPSQLDRAPDFDLPMLDSEGTLKLSDYRGEVVVINFWGSWCPPCRRELPMLQRTFADYEDKGVLFIGMNVGDSESNALAFMEEFQITYPCVIDIGEKQNKAYGLISLPQTFVIDKDGSITKLFFANPREAELRAAIEEALTS